MSIHHPTFLLSDWHERDRYRDRDRDRDKRRDRDRDRHGDRHRDRRRDDKRGSESERGSRSDRSERSNWEGTPRNEEPWTPRISRGTVPTPCWQRNCGTKVTSVKTKQLSPGFQQCFCFDHRQTQWVIPLAGNNKTCVRNRYKFLVLY